ncbi:TonB-dependent receptor [Pseudomonas sp. SDI]|uniref:TonB-dependent receptor n=1 Tax=Pseudomonas sp. SDI TaxID=2170734 RepID=UPI00211577AC|nr:TonB-dependent receptor [Pseudomonas sp. SDI]
MERKEVFYGVLSADLSDSTTLTGGLEYTKLDPVTGEAYEMGIKGEFYEGRLNTSFAVFRINQVGNALDDTASPNPCLPNYTTGYCKVAAGKNRNDGFEIKVSGEVLPGWQISGGYTCTTTEYLKDTVGNTGAPIRTTDPKRQLKLFTSYRLPGEFNAWTIGGGVQAQSDIYSLQLNANNKIGATPTAYYWGDPRPMSVTLRGTF